VHAAGTLKRPGLLRLVKERACVFVVFYKSWLRLVFACDMPPPGPKKTTVYGLRLKVGIGAFMMGILPV